MKKFIITLGGRGSEIMGYPINQDQREKLEHLNLNECLLTDVSNILEVDEMDLINSDEIYVGAYPENSHVTVENLDGEVIFQEDVENLRLSEIISEQTSTIEVYQSSKLYVNDSIKGTFLGLIVESEHDFDISKLELHHTEIEGLELITSIKYENQESEIGNYWSKGITFFLSNE